MPREPYLERLAAHRERLDRAVVRLVDACRSVGGVRAVYVFGSYARGEVRLSSDLDVLVVRETNLRRALRDLDIRLAFDVSVALDLLVVTPEEFASVMPSTSFGRTILQTAVRVDAA